MKLSSPAVLLQLVLPSTAQTSPPAERALERPEAPLFFEGVVLEPDGTPARGAEVESSAGGRTVTAPDGSFRLESRIPVDARDVEITASGRGGRALVASTRVGVTSSGTARVGSLRLVQTPGCTPGWLRTFGQRGLDGEARALAAFDDGTGTALYVGGNFSSAGGIPVNNLAKWDGASWSSVGLGLNFGVDSLLAYDDGSGPALYVGGNFSYMGGVDADGIVRWNGSD
jgi:hypothetical protein